MCPAEMAESAEGIEVAVIAKNTFFIVLLLLGVPFCYFRKCL